MRANVLPEFDNIIDFLLDYEQVAFVEGDPTDLAT